MNTIQLSVRTLVEFLLRTGSIDSRFTGFDRANEGARIHRKLQKEAGEGYTPEVFLSEHFPFEELDYQIEGRADGIFTDEADGMVVVDEIKTTTLPMDQITQDHNPVHWAQGMVYAAIYARQQSLEQIRVRLTYYQVDEKEILRYVKQFNFTELDAFLQDLLSQYAPWARRAIRERIEQRQSLSELSFPFGDYRPGQHAMAGEVYRTCRDGALLLCQAPTGIGKTMSVLFPALKAMAEGCGERIFYLTARTTTKLSAQGALSLLYKQNKTLALRSVILTAKDRICLCEKRECTPDACPYANGYYSRIRDALWDGLNNFEYGENALIDLAKKHTVCPFELQLDLSEWCGVIVGDYNYLFDPTVSLKRFFESRGDYLFLVDEAHNLPGRARDMHSASLEKDAVYSAKKALGKGRSRIKTALTGLNDAFVEYRHRCEEAGGRALFEAKPDPEFLRKLTRCCTPLQEWLEENRAGEAHEELLQLYFDLRAFLRVVESYDEHFVTQIVVRGTHVRVNLLCLDASEFLKQNFASGRSGVLFSATLTPPQYYKDLCGCSEAKAVALRSPFPQQNLGLYCAADVSTKYQNRDASLDRVAAYLNALASSKNGNYLAFFPSYSYLAQVHERFVQLYPGLPTLLQETGLDEDGKADFLRHFEAPSPDSSLLGFAVLGGVFGEGIDLDGDRLIGVAVVGVGLPQVNATQEKLRQFFEDSRGCGFDYAYRYPGMNKVLQAAGRVIRTPADRGVVLLIDERFGYGDYRRLFPAHWSHCRYLRSPDSLCTELAGFWDLPAANAE